MSDKWIFHLYEGDVAILRDEVKDILEIRVISIEDGGRVRLEITSSLKDHPIVSDEELKAQKQAELEAFYRDNPGVKRMVDSFKEDGLLLPMKDYYPEFEETNE